MFVVDVVRDDVNGDLYASSDFGIVRLIVRHIVSSEVGTGGSERREQW